MAARTTIKTAAMMLPYSLHLPEQAARIEKAIRTVLRKGVRTGDICPGGLPARRHPQNG
jgi:3-isopropylmalate dehydrogenase